uniref:Uncharacterized protein n=1 Tax=Triticum urartu TaxID=4572 RepID=A0A8R7QP47_TRIUA
MAFSIHHPSTRPQVISCRLLFSSLLFSPPASGSSKHSASLPLSPPAWLLSSARRPPLRPALRLPASPRAGRALRPSPAPAGRRCGRSAPSCLRPGALRATSRAGCGDWGLPRPTSLRRRPRR